jgi:TetR/AcrR family transcriptional regulator, repressor for uid operon
MRCCALGFWGHQSAHKRELPLGAALALEYNGTFTYINGMPDSPATVSRGRPVNAQARADRIRKILDGARSCFIRQGFHGASITEISTCSGVSPANIYQYFDSKDSLVIDLVKDDLERDLRMIKRVSWSRMRLSELRIQLSGVFTTQDGFDSAVLRCEILSEAARNEEVAKILRKHEEDSFLAIKTGVSAAIGTGKLGEVIDVENSSKLITLIFDGLLRRLPFMRESGEALMDEFLEHVQKILQLTQD